MFSPKKSILEDKVQEQEQLINSLMMQNREYHDNNNRLQKEKKQLESRLQEAKELMVDTISKKIDENNNSMLTNQNLTKTLLDIQGSIIAHSSKAQENITKTQEIEYIFESSIKNIHDIYLDIKELYSKSKSTKTITDQLFSKTKTITTAINQINDIALEINLISLDASLICATNSKINKEFSSVVESVKNLSLKTSNIAKEIDYEIKSIQETAQISSSKINEIEDSLDEIDNKSYTYENEINSVFNRAKLSFGGLNSVNSGVFNSLIKLDQVISNVNFNTKTNLEYVS
jgi:methyl-accepting chemotaxis protein